MTNSEAEKQLWNCGSWSIFEFLCPKTWEKLSLTDDADMRFCSVCRKDVFLCSTPEDFIEFGRSGKCVAILPSQTKGFASGSWLGYPSQKSLDSVASARRFWKTIADINRLNAIQQYFLRLSEESRYRPKEISYIVVDIGTLATHIVVISGRDMHRSQAIDIGSHAFNTAIIKHLKDSRNCSIGEPTAQHVRTSLSISCGDSLEHAVTVRGRDLGGNVPRDYSISADEVQALMQPFAEILVESVTHFLQVAGKDARNHLLRTGIYITGDSCTNGIDGLLAAAFGCHVQIGVKTECNDVIVGLCQSIENSKANIPSFA
jgi:hypothetical protein